MTQILKQSTAVDVLIGPFVDVTDGKTVEGGLTIAAANVRLSKAAQNIAAKTDATACVYDEVGMYNCELDATDTNTLGTLDLIVDDAAALTVVNRFQVIAANAYDALYGADSNILTARDVGQHLQDTVATVTSQTAFIMTTAIAHNDAWNGLIVSIEDVTAGVSVSRYITDVISSTKTIHINTACPFVVAAGDILRIESRESPVSAGLLKATTTEVAAVTTAVLADALATAQVLARSDAANNTDNSAKIAEINTDNGSGAGDFAVAADSLEAQADVCTEARLAELDAANLPATTDAGATAAALATTDAVCDAIKVKTDQMVYTKANELDVNTVSINNAEVVGDGNATPWDGV